MGGRCCPRKGFEVHTGTLEEARLEKGSIGCRHHVRCIGRIPDPRTTLREIRRLFARKGHLSSKPPTPVALTLPAFSIVPGGMIVQPETPHFVHAAGLRKMLKQEGFTVFHSPTHSLSGAIGSTFYCDSTVDQENLEAMNYRVGGLDLTRWISDEKRQRCRNSPLMTSSR